MCSSRIYSINLPSNICIWISGLESPVERGCSCEVDHQLGGGVVGADVVVVGADVVVVGADVVVDGVICPAPLPGFG
jgi:hypothetical protein